MLGPQRHGLLLSVQAVLPRGGLPPEMKAAKKNELRFLKVASVQSFAPQHLDQGLMIGRVGGHPLGGRAGRWVEEEDLWS